MTLFRNLLKESIRGIEKGGVWLISPLVYMTLELTDVSMETFDKCRKWIEYDNQTMEVVDYYLYDSNNSLKTYCFRLKMLLRTAEKRRQCELLLDRFLESNLPGVSIKFET